jgi:hypothetical protein
MKVAIGLALALALALSSVPAIAGDTFQAFSSMPALEQASLTPLSDEQLASIEGMDFCFDCTIVQRQRIRQLNVNLSAISNVSQVNAATQSQQAEIN